MLSLGTAVLFFYVCLKGPESATNFCPKKIQKTPAPKSILEEAVLTSMKNARKLGLPV